jgi:hypothetical protein
MTTTLENPAADAAVQTAPTGFGVDKSFTSRQAPWYKLGPQIEGDVDSAEAAKLGGLDFDVELRSAAFGSVSEKGNKTNVTVSNRKAIVRADTNAFIDFVSVDYRPVQYRDAFDFLDARDLPHAPPWTVHEPAGAPDADQWCAAALVHQARGRRRGADGGGRAHHQDGSEVR